MVFRVRTAPLFLISWLLKNQEKVASGLEAAEQLRLKSSLDLMNSGGLGGFMVTTSGPSAIHTQQKTKS